MFTMNVENKCAYFNNMQCFNSDIIPAIQNQGIFNDYKR